MNRYLLDWPIEKLLLQYPFAGEYLSNHGIYEWQAHASLNAYFEGLSLLEKEERAMDTDQIAEGLLIYIEQMAAFLGMAEQNTVETLTILPGYNKLGDKEAFSELILHKSEIISIVGPTGAGKSRLLADIEWTAQGDTPTKREILINGERPDKKWRFSSGNPLVAQLSQNMNFVMDLTVYEFLELHAKSRMVENEAAVIERIIEAANALAGEKFQMTTPVTALSGGQSRALMIADTAILSQSPIVLIDEIENAGIDRKKALQLLIGEEKIVLMATHDPLLALLADKRIVINQGGIKEILETTAFEKEKLADLEKAHESMQLLREKLRYGMRIED